MDHYSIIGDIGGTNARFAVVANGSVNLKDVQILQCADYVSLKDAIGEYLSSLASAGYPAGSVNSACFAFACPVDREVIVMTNNHWGCKKQELKEWLGVESLRVVNDFTAMAYGVPHLSADVLVNVSPEASQASAQLANQNKLVIGPGTGLGVSALITDGERQIPLSTEGGHVDFAPVTDREAELWRILHQRFGRVSIERILSGAGIVNVYQAFGLLDDRACDHNSAAEIVSAAQDGDPFCREVLSQFCVVLGRAAGNAVLTIGTYGGVYISGGVVPRFLDVFLQSDFYNAFVSKGRMRCLLESVPCYVVTEPYMGLIGAAAALQS